VKKISRPDPFYSIEHSKKWLNPKFQQLWSGRIGATTVWKSPIPIQMNKFQFCNYFICVFAQFCMGNDDFQTVVVPIRPDHSCWYFGFNHFLGCSIEWMGSGLEIFFTNRTVPLSVISGIRLMLKSFKNETRGFRTLPSCENTTSKDSTLDFVKVLPSILWSLDYPLFP
jgi:hypothetical protein